MSSPFEQFEPFIPPTSPPPPINWATRPNPATSTATDGRRLIPIFLDLDNLPDFEQAVFRLANPNHSSVRFPVQQDLATATITTDGRRLMPIFLDLDNLADFKQAVFRLANPIHSSVRLPVQQDLEVKPLERTSQEWTHNFRSDLARSSDDLSTSLSHLSVTATPSATTSSLPLRATTPPKFISRSSESPYKVTSTPSPTKKRKRYYVVTVGRCAGVFYDEWYYIFICLCDFSSQKYVSY